MGKLQSARDELVAIESAQRCIKRFSDDKRTAPELSPATLTLDLKAKLNRPFTSSYSLILNQARLAYNENPELYRNEQKDNIFNEWKITFGPQIENQVLQEKDLQDLIHAGVEAWEPPEEKNNNNL